MKVDRQSKLSFNNKFQVIQVLICPFRFLEKKKNSKVVFIYVVIVRLRRLQLCYESWKKIEMEEFLKFPVIKLKREKKFLIREQGKSVSQNVCVLQLNYTC